MRRVFGTPLRDYLPAAGLFVVTLLYLYLSEGYPARARAFPAMVAWVMLALLALDLLSRTETRVGLAIKRTLNPASDLVPRASGHAQSWQRQVTSVLWIAGFTTAIVLIGIIGAVPLYVFSALRFRGQRHLLTCLIAAAGATAFIYLLFGVVLRLNLYPGIFFSDA
jgi:hypothetical protein